MTLKKNQKIKNLQIKYSQKKYYETSAFLKEMKCEKRN